jgi:squalene synthase HpnC
MQQTSAIPSSHETFFHRELRRLGPHHPPAAWELSDANLYCRSWAKQQYENFTVVSCLLPRRFRQDFYNVYAYCRWSDNLADEIGSPDESRRLLDWWQGQLALCYSGRPAHPVLVALQATIQTHNLPIEPFTDLLAAFKQDQLVTRYADEAELLRYCEHSANPVGHILLRLAGAYDELNGKLSDEICTGLQLANFCQDMLRDAQMGRIYAPRSLWERHGVSESDLLNGRATPAMRSMLADWVESTRSYFDRGWPLVHSVPIWLATDLDLFVRGGLAILHNIEAAKFDVWSKRPVVSKPQQLQLLWRSMLDRVFGRFQGAANSTGRQARDAGQVGESRDPCR